MVVVILLGWFYFCLNDFKANFLVGMVVMQTGTFKSTFWDRGKSKLGEERVSSSPESWRNFFKKLPTPSLGPLQLRAESGGAEQISPTGV